MDWQQKWAAINALSGILNRVCLRTRKDGTWYVSDDQVERQEGGCLSGGLEAGKTPEEAVEQWWSWATDPNYYLVLRAYRNDRRAIRWNGFMWEDVQEDK